jgi:ubiquinone/menaquinone biosynthesis C-methylase UbiE/DNA-binding transcriptional ArsR family regulator
MDRLLAGLRAAAEPTRLRILSLLAEGELTVSEIVQVLGQSQPRVSRHLKLLCDAGLLDRLPEGQWVFYRLAEAPPSERETGIARLLAALVPAGDTRIALDAARLKAVKAARAEAAASYFAINAKSWDRIRSLYVDDREVEAALAKLLPDGTIPALLDIGTGTGRVLECLAGRIARGTGVDSSRDMLAVARARLAAARLSHCQVRQADMYALPMTAETFDAVTLHLVLHYADRPAAAIAEAARVLKPGGRLIVVDFAPHQVESLREQHAHRRLGFSDAEIAEWFAACGLTLDQTVALKGDPLTVKLWAADRREPARRGARRRSRAAETEARR